ncbi:MAG: hypothetical protein K2I00_01565 [Ruminococcus sp.]|nr:hypothetical protein [Ruminococcus sp.]
MFKLKIRLAAKREYKYYGNKHINNVFVWEKLPFIAGQLKYCQIVFERILSKAKKVRKTFYSIKAAQADYVKIIRNCDEDTDRIKKTIIQKDAKITSLTTELKFQNEQIQAFDRNEAIKTTENIFEIREKVKSITERINALESEVEALRMTIETIEKEAEIKLNAQYEELIRIYTVFSSQISATDAKIKLKIARIKEDAVLYTDFFWNLHIKQFIKKKKRENIANAEIPMKRELNTTNFDLIVDIFDKEKRAINTFTNDYNIKYTI